MFARTSLLRSTASRVAARRQMSTAEPKMHTAREKWSDLIKTRPPKDHSDEHLVFHPPFNGAVMGAAVAFCWIAGYGVIAFGMMHQQKKQGYWK